MSALAVCGVNDYNGAMGRPALAVALVLVAALATARADVTPRSPDTHLSWVRQAGAESCAPAPALIDDIVHRLGWNPFIATPTGGAVRSIEAEAAFDGTTWEARLWVRAPGAVATPPRRLQSGAPTCGPLVQAVGLAVALIIDPQALSRAPAAPAAKSPSVQPTTGRFQAGAAVMSGALPRAAAGFTMAGELSLTQRLGVSLGAVFLPEVHHPDDRNFAFGLTAATLGLCAALTAGTRAELAACGGLWLGAVHAVTFTSEPTRPGDRLWAGAAAGVRGSLSISGPWFAVATLDAVVPLTRYRFFAEGSQRTIYEQARVGAAAALGLGVHFR